MSTNKIDSSNMGYTMKGAEMEGDLCRFAPSYSDQLYRYRPRFQTRNRSVLPATPVLLWQMTCSIIT